jgi:hemoglobin-like flavoprotein
MESSTIKNKILLVLSKTEKALLADVQSEFLPLQKTMENEAKRLEESNSQFTDCKMLINAVFTQVGYDISHLEHTEELITEFSKVLASIDKLLKVLDENSGKDWIEKSENIFAAVKDFTGAMDGLLDTETDKVLDELQEVCEETKKKLFNRTLIKRILEHILITLLKNVRVVFADEIEFLRLLTESGVKSLEELSTLVQNNMSDAVGRFEALCERIGKKELAEIISEVNEAKDAINYEEIVHILNAAYAVLSFFGLIKEKTVELKVPNAILEKISTAGQDVNGLLVEIKNGGKDIAEGLDEIDKKISQVAITAGVMNVGIASLAEKESSINKYIDETETAVTNGTKKLASISIPVKILVFRWECFPKLFTSPYKYLQDLYPVNDVEDAQQLLVRIINVARAINPDIPDYSSLKNLLYSLLKQLENKVITMVENNEAVKETVRQIKTFIDEVKSLIEMLEEVAKDVRANLKVILETYNNVLLLLSKDLNDTLKAVSDAGDEIKETCIDAFNQLDKEVRENAETLYNELQKQLPEMNLKIDFTSLENEIKSVIVADINLLASDGTKTLQATDLDGCFEKLDKNLQTWSEDTYKDIYKKISPATWDKRINDTFSVLQAEFGNDMQLVSRLFSKKGAKDLISDFDGTTNKIFTQLDITDYVHIITTAVEEVILPDPVRYYDDFCEKVFKASLPSDEKLKECIAKIGKTGDDAEKIIKEIPSQIWDIVRKEVIGKLLSYIKEILLKALREVLNKYMEQKLAKDVFSAFDVQSKDVEKIASLGEDIRDYLVSGMKFGDTVKLLKKVYEDIPSGVKDAVGNLFPDLPSNDFFDYVKDMDVQVDLDNSFFVATVFDAKSSYKTDDAKTDISGKIQVCAFVKDGGLYIYPVIDAGTKVAIPIKNYQLTIGAEGSMNASAKGADGTKGDMIGVFLTKGTRHAFNGSIEEEWKALSGWLTLTFSRKENSEALKLFDTTYLGLTLKDFPQMIFFGYGTDLPKTITEGISKKSANGNLDFGYKGMIKDAEVIIHAKKMGAFFEQVFKDDVKVPFSTYIWYDFRNGFDFGGDARLKVDVDLHQLKIGNITFDKLDIELGSKKGKLFSNFLQDFSVDFKGMVLAFEGFGLDLKLEGFNSDSFFTGLGIRTAFILD